MSITQKFNKTVKISYLQHNKNLSLFQARITGFLAAKGLYVTTVDSDDELSEINIEYLINVFNQKPDVIQMGLVTGKDLSSAVSSLSHVQATDAILNGHTEIWNKFIAEKHWSLVGKFYCTKFLQLVLSDLNYQEKYINIAEDFALSTCLMYRANSFYRSLNIGKYFYRASENSLTRNPWYSKVDSLSKYLMQYERVRLLVTEFLINKKASDSDMDNFHLLWCSILKWVLPLFKNLLKNEKISELFFRAFPAAYSLDYLIKTDFELASSVIKQSRLNARSVTNSKISFIINSLRNGGAERVVATLSTLLSERGYDVSILTSKTTDNDYKIGSEVQLLTINVAGENRRRILLKYFLDNNVNTIIFVDHWILDTFNDILFFSYFGFKIIAQEHNTFWFPLYANLFEIFFKRKIAYTHCNYLTCLNKYDVELWRASGIKNVVYVPNLITFSSFSEVNPKIEVSNHKSILFVGRFHKLKGVDLIPDILLKVSKQLNNFSVYLCGNFGSEAEKKSFNEKLRALNLDRFIAFCGWRPDIQELYKVSDILILPSYVEGSPMVISEARAHGLPIVMFNLPYVDNADHGVIQVKMGDSDAFAEQVVKLLTDGDLFKQVSIDAIKNLDNWGSENVLKIWESILCSKPSDQNNETLEHPVSVNMQMLYQALRFRVDLFEKNKISITNAPNHTDVIKIRRYDKMVRIAKRFLPDGSLRKKIVITILKKCNRMLTR